MCRLWILRLGWRTCRQNGNDVPFPQIFGSFSRGDILGLEHVLRINRQLFNVLLIKANICIGLQCQCPFLKVDLVNFKHHQHRSLYLFQSDEIFLRCSLSKCKQKYRAGLSFGQIIATKPVGHPKWW